MIELRYCTVEFTPEGATTRFTDGTHIDATPHPEMPHYSVIAHRCGYQDDLLAYCQEHEVAHSLVAEWMQLAPSYVLWALAHGQKPSRWGMAAEEMMAQALQRFVRANERPIISGVDWDGLRCFATPFLDGPRV